MLNNYRFTLASGSPRRKELLAGLDIEFTVEPGKDSSEIYPDNLPHEEIPEFLALHKSNTFHRALEKNEVLITADTLVFLDDQVLGKPSDRDEAFRMIKSLSGRSHKVITGVTLRTQEETRSFSVRTDVVFAELSDEEILPYIDKYKPYDKAGAYGVQEWIGYIGISSINGSFYNVMGLPVQKLYTELKNICK